MSNSSTLPTDRAMIRQALSLVFPPSATLEVRALKTPTGTVAGYFNDHEKAVEAIAGLTGADGVYVSLNPVEPALLARAANQVKRHMRETTADSEVTERRWLFVDVDPVRRSGISATELEREAAHQRAIEVYEFLASFGWPQPLVCDSGNGYHLLYRVELPNDGASRDLLHLVLAELAFEFDDKAVTIDKKVYNAARLWKVPGTWACKGDSTEDRPHRKAHILKVPPALLPVPHVLLEDMANRARRREHQERLSQAVRGARFDIRAFIELHGVEVLRESPWGKGGHKWVITCPWNEAHTDNSAYICEHASGALSAGCHHNSCEGKKWQDLRELYEPGYRERRADAAGGHHDPDVAVNNEHFLRKVRRLREQKRRADRVPPFPVEVFPPAVGDYLTEAAQALPGPVDFIAGPLLPTAGALIGRKIVLQVKRSWELTPIISLGIIGPAGDKKTPSIQQVVKFLQQFQQEAYNRHQEELATYTQALTARRTGRNGEREAAGADTPKPEMTHYWTTDTTMEALAANQQHSAGMLVMFDELVAWVLSCDQYRQGKGADRQKWLSAWSATPIKVDRKKDGPLLVAKPHICVVGGVQPDVLPKLSAEAGQQDGFLDRILWVWPHPVRGHWTELSVGSETHREMLVLLRALADDAQRTDDQVLRFSPDARRLWAAWYDANEALKEKATGLSRGVYAKLPTQVGRIALVLHCLWHPHAETRPLEVGEWLLAHAITLGEYFRAHAHRVIAHFAAMGAGPRSDKERVQDALWGSGGDWMSTVQLHAQLGNRMKGMVLQTILAELLEAGKVERQTYDTQGRPGTFWRPLMTEEGEECEETLTCIDVVALRQQIVAAPTDDGTVQTEDYTGRADDAEAGLVWDVCAGCGRAEFDLQLDPVGQSLCRQCAHAVAGSLPF